MWDDARAIIFSPVIPAWAAFIVLLTRAWRSWPDIMQRWNERRKEIAAEKAADWDRLREEVKTLRSRLNEEIERADRRHQTQSAENERCHQELSAVRERLAKEIMTRRNMRGQPKV